MEELSELLCTRCRVCSRSFSSSNTWYADFTVNKPLRSKCQARVSSRPGFVDVARMCCTSSSQNTSGTNCSSSHKPVFGSMSSAARVSVPSWCYWLSGNAIGYPWILPDPDLTAIAKCRICQGLQEMSAFTVPGSQESTYSESGVCMIPVVVECDNALRPCPSIRFCLK